VPSRIVDSIYRTEGVDSIYFQINGTQYAIKDSTGESIFFGINDTTGIQNRHINMMGYTIKIDSSNVNINDSSLNMIALNDDRAVLKVTHGASPATRYASGISSDSATKTTRIFTANNSNTLFIGNEAGNYNGIVISSPGTPGGSIQINKQTEVVSQSFGVANLSDLAVGLTVSSTSKGGIVAFNTDASGFLNGTFSGKIFVNRQTSFPVTDRILGIFSNFDTNDSVYHVRGTGDVYFKGVVVARADSTTSATGGFLYRDAATGSFRITAGPAGATTLYSGDGSLAGARTITGGSNILTITGTQSSLYELNISNTGNGGAISGSTSGTGSAAAFSNSGSGAGVTGSSSLGFGGNFTSTSSAGLRTKTTPSSTNTTVTTFRAIRGSSGTPATNMGNAWDMQLTDNAGNDITTTRFSSVFSDATTASPDADFNLLTITNASLTNKLSVFSTGQLQFSLYTPSNFLAIDTTNYKPLATDASGNIYRMSGWAATGGSSTTLYNGDGTVAGDRNANVNNHNLTFSDANIFKISADFIYHAKADGSRSYGEAIDPSSLGSQAWQFAYSPFTRGIGLYVDTLNNVGLGDNVETTSPLYTNGNSTTIAWGLQSENANYYKVSNITTNTTLNKINYNFITVDATSGNVTITLPAASASFGDQIGLDLIFKRLDNSGNTVTIQRAGSDTIDGATSFALTTQYESKRLRAISTSAWANY
jgi:hypothetical protein